MAFIAWVLKFSIWFLQIMNVLFHLWFHAIRMLSEPPEFTRTHHTQASRLRVGWVVLRHMDVFPPWYFIVTQRDFHTNKGHEMLHSLQRSMGLQKYQIDTTWIRQLHHWTPGLRRSTLGMWVWLLGLFSYTCQGGCLLTPSHWRCSCFSLSSQTSRDAPHASKTI